ncbi:MAG: DUF3817 domain-containing protein [Proteobacteria bacterium]|nr:DUF3817 domain-containing protein [Pseudomonadota bacterium]
MSKSLSFFRLISLIEGTSLIALVFIAMPLKYQFGYGEPVLYVGWAHGVLFLSFLLSLLIVSHIQKWSVGFFLLAFVSSIIPTGTWLLDIKLKKMVTPRPV